MFSTFFLQADTLAAATTNTVLDGVATGQEVSALSFLLKGGVFIYPIILLLFYTIYLIIERIMFINKATKQDARLLNDVKSQLNAGKIDAALAVCYRDNSAASNVLQAGISTIGRPINEIESKMEKSANIEIGEMEKKLGYLGLISGIAPILGFIGTISGVIKIFYSISVTENISIGNISGGLYEKMISSGAGLVVGVIAYSAYHIFNVMIDNFSLNVQKQVLEFINIIQQPSYENKKE
ncbi:MotA/TolQ/ExbB proton channel family protein [Flavobacterium kingsejongi]|uniref:Biopolymer transporter ExbB n=1 Tax=Flavobacterium kingsejongi TaxID=1678728 RepID=A0A2S1LUH2_9FLAO|nr:MotA/TolQ/ExbB proton channel family protein [Flavobacterium kingsejongi]AWG27358.1 biopolymer transporter ExbB [Flavobacterium kingsejongi]